MTPRSRDRQRLAFGAFCQGMLGPNIFPPTNWGGFPPFKPLEVIFTLRRPFAEFATEPSRLSFHPMPSASFRNSASGKQKLRMGMHGAAFKETTRDAALFLACFLFFFSFLVLCIFTGGLQKTKFFATIPRVEMDGLEGSFPPYAKHLTPGHHLCVFSRVPCRFRAISCVLFFEGTTQVASIFGESPRPPFWGFPSDGFIRPETSPN